VNDLSYKELSPDFWKRRSIHLVPDNISIWKALICLRGTTELVEDTEYRAPICDWNHVKRLFPDTDEELDAATAAIRAASRPAEP
jgi:hypothetical protein